MDEDEWGWPTWDAWCADFEKGMRNGGLVIDRREPDELSEDGYVWFLKTPTGGAAIKLAESQVPWRKLLPMTFATIQVVNPLLHPEVT